MVANSNWIGIVRSLLTRIVKNEPFSIGMFSSLGQLLAAGNLPEKHILIVSYSETLNKILFINPPPPPENNRT